MKLWRSSGMPSGIYSTRLCLLNTRSLMFIFVKMACFVFMMPSTIAAGSRQHPVAPGSLPGSHGIYYNSRHLQHDKLFSDLLQVRKIERYFFTIRNGSAKSVSATVMPCTSKLNWEVQYRSFEIEGQAKEERLATYREVDKTMTYHQDNPPEGIYILQVYAWYEKSYVKFFVSTKAVVDPRYWEEFDSNISMLRGKDKQRQKYHALTLKWRSSLIRPYDMQYCLVINQEKAYNTLCEAQGRQFGVPYNLTSSQVDKRYRDFSKGEMIMGCVGRRTKYKLSLRDFTKDQQYYLDLFILDKSTSLSYLYGRMNITWESFYPKKKRIKDGKRQTIEIRAGQSCKSRKYRLKKDNATIYVMTDVCTGSVSTEIIKGKVSLKKEEHIEDNNIMNIENAKMGRYKIKVCRESDDKKHVVKLMVTTNKNRATYPELPNDTAVTVADHTLNCNSATIRWKRSTDPESQRYCVLVWRDGQKHPDYCKAGKPPCEKKPDTTNPWVSENIGNLEPGQRYNVQVQVYKNKKKRCPPRNYQTVTIEAQPYCLSSRNYVNSNNIRQNV